MSISHIPESVKIRLWGKAAGRCEYEGCNKSLWIDGLTEAEFNTAYIAHIIADSPNGPRGNAVLSKQLKDDLSNLMLMCDEHHRLIDKADIEGHPVERLTEMKRIHEERMELLTSIQPNKKSKILMFGANIGQQNICLSRKNVAQAMIPDWYPEHTAIELSLKNSHFKDAEEDYWNIECTNLERQFESKVRPVLQDGSVEHLSIFGLAPQPLLIKLGALLTDIHAAQVYQLHREPPNWIWQNYDQPFEYELIRSESFSNPVALNISLSATINNSRITPVLGENVSIWTIRIAHPSNDYLKSKEQLKLFREKIREAFDTIKAKHGQSSLLHVFPAMPVSVAVELGRVYMPKADMALRIYDQNSTIGGFAPTLDIGEVAK